MLCECPNLIATHAMLIFGRSVAVEQRSRSVCPRIGMVCQACLSSQASAVTTSPNPDALPLRFPSGLRFTPEQFELVCAENREAVVE